MTSIYEIEMTSTTSIIEIDITQITEKRLEVLAEKVLPARSH
jgi:hypothetical protein